MFYGVPTTASVATFSHQQPYPYQVPMSAGYQQPYYPAPYSAPIYSQPMMMGGSYGGYGAGYGGYPQPPVIMPIHRPRHHHSSRHHHSRRYYWTARVGVALMRRTWGDDNQVVFIYRFTIILYGRKGEVGYSGWLLLITYKDKNRRGCWTI